MFGGGCVGQKAWISVGASCVSVCMCCVLCVCCVCVYVMFGGGLRACVLFLSVCLSIYLSVCLSVCMRACVQV
jgi:hypothetical protein